MTIRGQLALPLAYRPAHGARDFLVSPSNEAAWRAATAPDSPMVRRLAISGAEGSGKTHLAHIWGGRMNAVGQPLADLTEQRMEALFDADAIVLEDGDRIAALPGPARRQVEVLLFHLLNVTSAQGTPLLLTGRMVPARWVVQTQDVVSRLLAMPHAAIQPPDDELLAAILRKLFEDRQLVVRADVIDYLIKRMDRSFASAEALVTRLDQMSLASRRAVTRPLATELFADVATEPDDET